MNGSGSTRARSSRGARATRARTRAPRLWEWRWRSSCPRRALGGCVLMGRLTHPVVDTTAVLESLSGDYQFWTLENPDTNAQAIFYNQNATATTTATQSKPVRPGQTAFFFVNAWDNPNGVSLIAATAAQTVNLVKETFRTRLGYQIAVLAAGVAASVANLWRTVAGSTTAIEPVGAIVEARADTVRNKTAGTALTVTTQAASDGMIIG